MVEPAVSGARAAAAACARGAGGWTPRISLQVPRHPHRMDGREQEERRGALVEAPLAVRRVARVRMRNVLSSLPPSQVLSNFSSFGMGGKSRTRTLSRAPSFILMRSLRLRASLQAWAASPTRRSSTRCVA